MKPTRLLLIGAAGKMGLAIEELAQTDGVFQVVESIDRNNFSKLTKVSSKDFDVAIDFSSPEITADVASALVKLSKPLVCGTTGIKDPKALSQAAKKIPVLYSANMSVGVNLLQRALAAMGEAEGFDIAIEEIHHRNKKDNPSGTALLLKKTVEFASGRKVGEPVGLRGGGVFGVHRVFFLAEEEILEFAHTALNRKIFARGALRAASWVLGKKPGLYSMLDVLE